MKISSNTDHPDYHDVVNFIDCITVNDVVLKNCVHIDTDAGEAGEAECFNLPLKAVDGCVKTHTVKGKIDITWRLPLQSQNKMLGSGARALFYKLKADWERREFKGTR